LLKSRLHPYLTGSANVVARPFCGFICIVTLCQKLTLLVDLDEYTVLFAFARKQARFAQTNRHIYLLLKKEKHNNLDT
jgi:hypothetical protein